MSLSYLDIEKSSVRRIWALNKTPAKERRQLIFTVQKGNGIGNDIVLIPSTWIPIDLTGQVPKKHLISNSDFRRAVASGIIEVLSEAEAASVLKQEGASSERDRIGSQLMNVNSVTQKGTIEEGEDTARDELESSAKIVQFVEDMKVSDEVTALNSVRSMGVLELNELRFVRKAAKAQGFMKIRKYCNLEIKRIKGEIDNRAQDM